MQNVGIGAILRPLINPYWEGNLPANLVEFSVCTGLLAGDMLTIISLSGATLMQFSGTNGRRLRKTAEPIWT